VDPNDVSDIAEKLLALYRDDRRRMQLRELGLLQAQKYRAGDLGGVTVRAYEQAASP